MTVNPQIDFNEGFLKHTETLKLAFANYQDLMEKHGTMIAEYKAVCQQVDYARKRITDAQTSLNDFVGKAAREANTRGT